MVRQMLLFWLVDRPGLCSSEGLLLVVINVSRQPVWKSSSESEDDFSMTQVVEMSVTTNNSRSREYTNPDDQPTTNIDST